MSERAPWGDFPPVLRNGELGSLKLQPEYEAAKGGDRAAALAMVSRLVTHEFLDQMREQLAGRKPVLVPVLAVEQGGLNKIPLAFARVVGHHLGLPVATEIGMREKVGRTNSGSDHRLVACPSFAGEVEAGQEYVILDDTVSMGGDTRGSARLHRKQRRQCDPRCRNDRSRRSPLTGGQTAHAGFNPGQTRPGNGTTLPGGTWL